MPGWHRRKYWFLSTSASSGEPTVPALWKALTQSTTTHGISHVQKAKGAVKKYFWATMMTLALGALIFNISAISYIYFLYNVNVYISLKHDMELHFPAVTICNMSPIRQAYLEQNPAIMNKISSYSNRRRRRRDTLDSDSMSGDRNGSCCCSCYFEVGLNENSPDIGACNSCRGSPQCVVDVSSGNDTTTFNVIDGSPEPIPGSIYPQRVQTRDDFKAMERLTQALASLTIKERQTIGYQAEDLILDCQYAGSDCYLREFASFYNPVQGNCYIFNSGWNSTVPLLTSKKSGRRHGLHLTLNIDQDEYMKEVGETAGLRLVVHPQSRMPFPEDEGISVAPGQVTSIGLKQVKIERERPPYGDCQKPDSGQDMNAYAEVYPVKYSTSACFKTCYQRSVVQLCGCADPYYPVNKAVTSDQDVMACDFNDITQDDCMYSVGEMFNENNLTCSCLTPCSDMTYSLELSTGVWPSNVQKEAVFNKLSSKIAYLLNDRLNPNKYKENLIKLEIYYEEFNYQDMEERPAYPPQKYLSDLGGALGLWLGMSMLSIVEFFEFFMDVAVLLTTKLCSGGSKVRADSQADLKADMKAEMRQYEKTKAKKGGSQKFWVPEPLRAYYFSNWAKDEANQTDKH